MRGARARESLGEDAPYDEPTGRRGAPRKGGAMTVSPMRSEKAALRDPTLGRSALITSDLECLGCGYNLKGLPEGGVCPECGRTIIVRGPWADEPPMNSAPVAYLATLSLGAMVMAIGGTVNFFNAAPLVFFASASAGAPSFIVMLVHLAGAIAWCAGLFVTLRHRPIAAMRLGHDGVRKVEWRELRYAAMTTQLVWPAVAILRYLQFSTTSAAPGWIAHALVIVGAAGWAPVALHTSFLADWAHDTGIAGRLRAAMWGFAVLGAAMLAMIHLGTLNLGWTNLIFLFSGVVLIGWLLSYFFLILGILQLGGLAQWAIANSCAESRRDQRRMEKVRKEIEQRRRRDGEVTPGFLPDPAVLRAFEESLLRQAQRDAEAPNGPPHDSPRPGSSTPTIPRPADTEPYQVEGES